MKTQGASVRAIIIAEGGSARLRPLTDHLPSSLVPVGGTPVLDSQIQTLLQVGCRDITVIGGYRAAQVEQACRSYPTVQFRTNPDYSREEPRLSALFAAGAASGTGAILILRGDLIVAPALVEAAAGAKGDLYVASGSGRAIGLYRLEAESLQALLESGREGAGRELFSFLDAQLKQEKAECHSAGNHPWARVVTMEDLARALKAHRGAAAARVEDSEKQLQKSPPAAVSSSAPEEKPQVVFRGRVGEESELEPEGGLPFLPRPLLRVLHR